MSPSASSLVQLVCPSCKQAIVADGPDWKCPACQRPFTRNRGILSFLTPEERFNEEVFEEAQIAAWTDSARLREKIRASKFLTLIDLVRIKYSLSGRRDRIFRDEMKPRGGPHRLILDIGCGGGRHYFCEYGTVIGIDPVLPLLQMAKEIYKEVYQSSGYSLPFADASFDYVVSSDVIGHISDAHKDKLFAEIHRILKPGGRTVHCSEVDSINPWFRFAHKYPDLFQLQFVDTPGHIGLELPSQLRQRFLKHGFREITFRKLSSVIQEPGTIAGRFDNEFKSKSKAIAFWVAVDWLFSRTFAMRQALNFLLEPLARIDDWLTPLDYTSGALIVYETK